MKYHLFIRFFKTKVVVLQICHCIYSHKFHSISIDIFPGNTSLSTIIRKLNYKNLFFNFTIFCFKPRFPLDSKWEYLSIIFGRQFSDFKRLRFRRHISSNIVKYRQISSNIGRLKYKKFFIIIARYHGSLWLIL